MIDIFGQDGLNGLFLFGGCALLAVFFIITALAGLVRWHLPLMIPGAILSATNMFATWLTWGILNRPHGSLALDDRNINIFAHPVWIFSAKIDWADCLLIPWLFACFVMFARLKRDFGPTID